MVTPVLDELEVLVRALGLVYARQRDAILVEIEEDGERIGIAITYDEVSDTVRVAAPLDVEPLPEALSWYLEENFKSTTYKYALDYDGFVTVVYDLPRRYIRTARDLREAIVSVVSGAKRVLERVERREETEEGGETSS
ncbi:hypothetical protein Pyrfu_1390 [Pyrolobus fumarii 1A]|uniref:Uncharacterized protein n=1 Tax=Pyrolobus fumarii (strain DSM 11204 / 1A) TaxID=694429 RepID=G0EGV0_PYRF1|nr:hypothetical protein [Pyrolobus fumarii]AEM39248.1 hypothetical protein Pyrfu_1390 [Pyrolobus fumarii 1A]